MSKRKRGQRAWETLLRYPMNGMQRKGKWIRKDKMRIPLPLAN